MRYVSELYVSEVDMVSYSCDKVWKNIRLVLRDTDKAGSWEVVGENAAWVKALGVSCYTHPLVFVKHDKKAADFHRYLDNVSVVDVNETAKKDTDVLFLGSHWIKVDGYEVGSKDLVIKTFGSGITCNGFGGSCIKCGREYWTVYDLLKRLCQAFERNLLVYRRIEIVSDDGFASVRIDLSHSIEAERFYAKMWMECIGKKG